MTVRQLIAELEPMNQDDQVLIPGEPMLGDHNCAWIIPDEVVNHDNKVVLCMRDSDIRFREVWMKGRGEWVQLARWAAAVVLAEARWLRRMESYKSEVDRMTKRMEP